MGLVDGKAVFVTGAARGLGHAVMTRLAAAGARGTVFDIIPVAESKEIPCGWEYVEGDVSCENLGRVPGRGVGVVGASVSCG